MTVSWTGQQLPAWGRASLSAASAREHHEQQQQQHQSRPLRASSISAVAQAPVSLQVPLLEGRDGEEEDDRDGHGTGGGGGATAAEDHML